MIKQIIKLPVLSFLLGLTLLIGSANAAWELPPEEFSPAYGGSIDIASDADGNAIVVIDDANTVTVAAFQYTRATNTWTGPTTLANANGFANIALDRDPYGTALAIWIDNINTELHSSYFDGSTWTIGSPDPFATATDVNSYNLDMNGPNTGLAVWIDGGGTNQALSSFFSAGSWSAIPVPIAPSDGVQSAAAYSSNGTAVAGFDNLNALQVSNYNGSVWLSPVTLDPAIAFTSHNIVLGIDSTGKALAVWVNTAGDVKSSTFDGISNWSAAVTISSTSGNDPFTTSISMSPNGTAVATWIDGASTGWSNSYNGTTWNVPQQFSDDAINANVSVNIHGNALVLFTTSTNQLYSKRLPLGGVWSAPEFLFDASTFLFFISNLDASLSDNEFGFAAWGVGDEFLEYFAAVEIATPAPPTGINGSSCSNRFASQTDLVNIITFTPSPSPTVAAYYLRRNETLIAVIPAAGPYIYFDHNRSKKITDVYTLTAVGENGQESTPIVLILHD